MWRRWSAGKVQPRADGLKALLHEALGRRVGDVHVLDAKGADVRLAQRGDDVLQPHPRRPGLQRPDVELRLEVAFREPVRAQVEIRDVRRLLPLQRIQIGDEYAERAELADEAQHEHLFVHRGRIDHRAGDFAVLRELDERRDHRGVRDVVGTTAEFVEVDLPLAAHACRIGKVLLVQLLDERRVAAEQRAAVLEFGHAAHGGPSSDGGGARAGQLPARHRRFSASRSTERSVVWRPRTAGAGARSCTAGRRPSRSVARSSRQCERARRSP